MRALALSLVLFAAAAGAAGCGGRERDNEDAAVLRPCTGHGDCASDEVCIAGSCEPGYGRQYRIGITSVYLSRAHDPDGQPWDEDGSGPDPFVCLLFGWRETVEEHCTGTATDTFEPWFNEFTVVTTIEERVPLEVRICDEDPEGAACWTAGLVSQVPITALRATTITFFPEDPARQSDYAVTLSFQAL